MAFDDRQQWWDAADELSVRVRLAIVRISCGVRRPWFVQPPKAAFVHNDVPYTDALLQRAFSGRPEWQLAAHRDDPDRRLVLQIDEYEELPWERVLAGSIVANAYCVRKVCWALCVSPCGFPARLPGCCADVLTLLCAARAFFLSLSLRAGPDSKSELCQTRRQARRQAAGVGPRDVRATNRRD